MECLEGFVSGLYQDAFNAIVYLINRSITTTNNANASITVLDMPGFQVDTPDTGCQLLRDQEKFRIFYCF